MHRSNRKWLYLLILILSFVLLSGFATSNYSRKVEPLPNMPEGNPDLSVGIVVRSHSTGRDVVADSSENIRFSASKNFEKTEIAQLRSSSMVDRTPKKFKFFDEKHSLSSDNVYEFTIFFDSDNHEWHYISFMPFASVIEWVTEEKLKEYLNIWVKKFEEAGWQRVEYPKTDNPSYIQNFSIPTPEYDSIQYISWKTKEYKARIVVKLRRNFNYKNYLSKEEFKKIKEIPNGYIAFIQISRKKI